MTFGFGTLRLSSVQFWAMTPREMTAAAAAFEGGRASRETAPTRATLEALMARFPD